MDGIGQISISSLEVQISEIEITTRTFACMLGAAACG